MLLKNLPLFLEDLLHPLLKLSIFSHHLSYEFFNQADAHGLVCVQFLSALNSHLGGDKNISKNAMTEFLQNLSLQALNELDETTNTKFDAVNELNKSINNLNGQS